MVVLMLIASAELSGICRTVCSLSLPVIYMLTLSGIAWQKLMPKVECAILYVPVRSPVQHPLSCIMCTKRTCNIAFFNPR